MKKIVFTLALGSLIVFSSCADDRNSNSNLQGGLNVTTHEITSKIRPFVSGNYNRWQLGSSSEFGYLETMIDNNFTSFNFNYVCEKGVLRQEVTGNWNRWYANISGSGGAISIRTDVTNDANAWTFVTDYGRVFKIKTSRPDDFNSWQVTDAADANVFTMSTETNGRYDVWKIKGIVPETHTDVLIGFFFIPVWTAIQQDL